MSFKNGAWVVDEDTAIVIAIRAAYTAIGHQNDDSELMAAYTLARNTLNNLTEDQRQRFGSLNEHLHQIFEITLQVKAAIEAGDMEKALRLRDHLWKVHEDWGGLMKKEATA